MNNKYDIGDDEIMELGSRDETVDRSVSPRPPKPSSTARIVKWGVILAVLLGLIFVLLFMLLRPRPNSSTEIFSAHQLELEKMADSLVMESSLASSDDSLSKAIQFMRQSIKKPLARTAETGEGFIELADTTINDIPLQIYLPHDVSFSLHVGPINRSDSGILFAAQAADVRADNGGIVGAFVLKGEPKAWGLSKKGFCAIINDKVTVGVADNSPLFEEATETEGYFFRQFPLVDKGRLVENEQKGKSIRRAICTRGREIFVVETLTTESLHDFAQALADLGVDYAVYLVGGSSYGWTTDAKGQRHEFGNPDPPKKKWKNINFLVMRSKN